MATPAAAIADEQALARRIADTLPRPASPAGHECVAAWLAEIAPTATGAGLGRLLAELPAAAALIDRIAESSPYLWDLASREPPRLLRLLTGDPDFDFARLIADARSAVAAAPDEAAVMYLLRRLKAEAALLIAIADIGRVWPVTRIIRALTELADAAVASAVDYLLRRAARSGKLNVPDAAAPAPGSGYVVFAMGKMGAFELNYSSDVDLIVFFDGAAAALAPDIEPATFFVRLTRSLVKILQERTHDGYVFRVDLRLRPDPASTLIAMPMAAALGYYEGTGQNWERAALIKARPCAGDIA
ncbi:MAG TPA: bifunctional [glutamine synthetase] adenylyltransferase/[glutamine synthetase]-adenylyl-L-tyrosine phosphorylase, partial [Xanthobacteraceae bacterium]|nr:bifunctional [glutamine synthetase] adenylyltransferase/[glutamine synthetase]-adenylyl-L-tyrosine phosphorylase [Xanthobacteraceae bacterium]